MATDPTNLLGGQAAGGAGDLIKDATAESFMADVVDASMDAPVIVDFWAEWCGPCKQLGPRLEQAVRDARGAVRLVKVDVDKNQALAQQLRIQSIPAVIAFAGGRPVDGFSGAVPDSQINSFVDRLVKAAGAEVPSSPIEDALAQAQELVESGDFATASALYGQILAHEPGNRPARAGRARCLIEARDLEGARQALGEVSDEDKEDAAIAAALSALSLAEKSAGAAGETDSLRARIEADPADHQARYDLALALYGSGDKEAAIDALVEIIRRNKAWNEEAARKQLLEFFEAMGNTDPLTVAGRRKLSSVLFS